MYVYSREVSKALKKSIHKYLHLYWHEKIALAMFLINFYPNSNVPKPLERNDLSCMRISDMRRECEIPIGVVVAIVFQQRYT